LNTSLREVVVSSALGDGASRAWVDRDLLRWNEPDPRLRSSLRRITDYITAVPAPRFPLPIDTALAADGEAIYRQTCAPCHAAGGSRTGTVVPVEEVGTDPHRLEMWTPEAATAYNAYGDRHAWDMSRFRSTGGYVAVPHDGLWLRAPYLHNGSVPTLADLLEPPASRPARFWRGLDLIDPIKVGFVTSGAEAQRAGTLYDTSRPGNGNGGHLYGTDLPVAEKRALLEYLKTR
jgi:mono/diheme cytochrome c family protein